MREFAFQIQNKKGTFVIKNGGIDFEIVKRGRDAKFSKRIKIKGYNNYRLMRMTLGVCSLKIMK